ncbi:hypothetical protein ABEB36_015569 [Hypothenemus hampei]|uniref:Uncharacterized protein n=1 Tax=Hypothenemus hampei TaxID=57062 RepID=A0ABD1DZB5_HYPHA
MVHHKKVLADKMDLNCKKYHPVDFHDHPVLLNHADPKEHDEFLPDYTIDRPNPNNAEEIPVNENQGNKNLETIGNEPPRSQEAPDTIFIEEPEAGP